MVYQRTRLGPPVWNIGYADAALMIKLHGFLEVVFADDLNCFKDFGLFTPNCMRKCSNAREKYTNQGRRTKLALMQGMDQCMLKHCVSEKARTFDY